MGGSKSRGHFRKTEKVKATAMHVIRRRRRETDMEKKPEGKPEPMGPPAPKPADDKPAEETPQPGRPPHWHEGDPEPAGEEAQHLPPDDDDVP